VKYLKNVTTLRLDRDACTGCGMCVNVCPHGVFTVTGGKAEVVDPDACMECGACQQNCAFDALTVRSGVGCAAGIILGALGIESACCQEPEGKSESSVTSDQ
jgi:ferredoxin